MLRGLSQSAENSLAMKVVAGGRLDPASPSAAPEEFLRFWNAPTGPDAAKLWDAMAANDSPVDDLLPIAEDTGRRLPASAGDGRTP